MTPQQDLDQAIDAVARQLTHVDDDPVFASTIVASLPERVTWLGWLVTSWAPRLAVLLIAAASSALLINREPKTVAESVLPAARSAVNAELRSAIEPVQPLEAHLRTKPLEPLEPLEPQAGDHEYSLPALSVEALPPMNTPVESSIELAPLAIADLPLTGEFPEKY